MPPAVESRRYPSVPGGQFEFRRIQPKISSDGGQCNAPDQACSRRSCCRRSIVWTNARHKALEARAVEGCWWLHDQVEALSSPSSWRVPVTLSPCASSVTDDTRHGTHRCTHIHTGALAYPVVHKLHSARDQAREMGLLLYTIPSNVALVQRAGKM